MVLFGTSWSAAQGWSGANTHVSFGHAENEHHSRRQDVSVSNKAYYTLDRSRVEPSSRMAYHITHESTLQLENATGQVFSCHITLGI